MLELSLATCSERGLRAANEDALCVGRAGSVQYAVVSDGAGGHARGAEASRIVVAHVDQALRSASFGPEALTETLLSAHLVLQNQQIGAMGHQRMHATVLVLWLDTRFDRVVWSHIGDSRLYRFHYGAVELLTADDSVVQRLLEGGALTREQAEDHPMKNRLLAAVGMQEGVDPHTLAAPQALVDGDAFLLCSDGWWGALNEAEMASALVAADTPQGWLHAMRALIEARQVGGQDNYTAVAVWASDPAESTRAMGEEETLAHPLSSGVGAAGPIE